MTHKGALGIFDSGFGGLTVFKELEHLLPHEQMLYLGDTANLPYGTKSREAIIRYTSQSCYFLVNQGVKGIVIACNTATSMALEVIQSQFNIPIIGVIDPVIEDIAYLSTQGRIGILATRATIASGVYQQRILKYLPKAEITPVAAPILVNLIEEGFIDHPMTSMAIEEYVQPLKSAGVDTLILACTHFPLLKNMIQKLFAYPVKIIDPAFACAKATKKTLIKLNLLSTSLNQPNNMFYVTDDPEKFARLGPFFLNHRIDSVQLAHLYHK